MSNEKINIALIDNDEMDEIVVVLASETALTLNVKMMTRVNGWTADTVNHTIRWHDERFIEIHADSYEERVYLRGKNTIALLCQTYKILACILEMSAADRDVASIKDFIKTQF